MDGARSRSSYYFELWCLFSNGMTDRTLIIGMGCGVLLCLSIIARFFRGSTVFLHVASGMLVVVRDRVVDFLGFNNNCIPKQLFFISRESGSM